MAAATERVPGTTLCALVLPIMMGAMLEVIGLDRAARATGGAPAPHMPGRLSTGMVPPAGLSAWIVAFAALAVYVLSAALLTARDEVYLFGADTVLYAELAKGPILERLGNSYAIDRITRFHPLTTAMAVAWMQALQPLMAWIAPQQLLTALFATVGAVGVRAAVAAFAVLVPPAQARLWGLVYAFSLGVWYFSSIEESKIVTATLAALYIAVYLHLRRRWTVRGAVLLTVVLLLACLNEIIAAFLLAIPALDTLVRCGRDLRASCWIAWHGLVAPAVFVLLEVIVKPSTGATIAAGPATEGASHLSMLLFYIAQNDLSPATVYAFLVNWLFFNIAAPGVQTTLAPAEWPEYMAYFEPVLRSYLASPVSAALLLALAMVLGAGVMRTHRLARGGRDLAGVMAGLSGYAVLRGIFFLVVNPKECMLYGSGVTLAHLLLLAIPFGVARLPGKRALLAACVALLIVVNGAFIIGR